MLREEQKQRSCGHCLRGKVCFWELQPSFLRKFLIDIKTKMRRIENIVQKSVKCAKCVGAVFEQKLAFELFERHFERKIDWQDLIMNQKVWKIVKRKTETGNSVTSAFQQKFTFQVFGFISKLIFGLDRQIHTIDWRNFFFRWTTQSPFVGQEETLTLFLEYLKRSKLCQLSAWGKEWCQEQSSLSTIYWLHPIQHSQYLQ